MVATQSERGALPIDVASRGLETFEVSVDPRDVVFVKGVVEASDGLASIFAEPRARGAAPVGGDLLVACHASRAAELRELLDDLGCKARRRGDDERALDDDGHSEAIAAPESAEVDDVR